MDNGKPLQPERPTAQQIAALLDQAFPQGYVMAFIADDERTQVQTVVRGDLLTQLGLKEVLSKSMDSLLQQGQKPAGLVRASFVPPRLP